MRILHLSTSDDRGGAARAAYRIHQGVQRIGLGSRMLVQFKRGSDRTVVGPGTRLEKGIAGLRPSLDSLLTQLYRHRQETLFSPALLPDRLSSKVAVLNADVIHLHWMADGFLRIGTLKRFQKPLIWTLHDMWAFTGGCHLDNGCGRYKASCGMCPMLASSKERDLSRWVWQRKHKAWQRLNLTVVTPSRWLADCARASALFKDVRVEVIPHGLDVERFKPSNQRFARELLLLPQDKKLILWGSEANIGKRLKGFYLLDPSLRELAKVGWGSRTELVVFGASEPANPPHLPVRVHYLGRLQDEVSLALLYAAGDVLVVSSPQEAFGQVASEAMACGLPVVAFGATGLLDIVDHQRNGYLAEPFAPECLARGIVWVLEDAERWQSLSRRARQKAETEFALPLMAERYAHLYREVCSGSLSRTVER